jgi:hypothetical protein
MNTQYLIDVWLMLEDKYDKVLITLNNTNKHLLNIQKITISNSNNMKYLDVYVNDSKNVYQSFTHIQSFVNEMVSMFGNDIFSNYCISHNDYMIKRKYNDDSQDNDNKKRRIRCD